MFSAGIKKAELSDWSVTFCSGFWPFLNLWSWEPRYLTCCVTNLSIICQWSVVRVRERFMNPGPFLQSLCRCRQVMAKGHSPHSTGHHGSWRQVMLQVCDIVPSYPKAFWDLIRWESDTFIGFHHRKMHIWWWVFRWKMQFVSRPWPLGSFVFSEIYKIVSQRQIRESPDSENSPSNNVQTITVAPTDTSAGAKKQCCNI